MRRIDRHRDSMFTIENSSVDPNRFYSILLDARAASVSDNMCDIAEKLLQTEKENAQTALDQLLKLKNNLFSEANPTIEMLVSFYEDKLASFKEREERLKKVNLDSRSLLEDKRRRDEEIATVKQQVTDCTRELDELSLKLEKLKIREQELTLIEHQLREELNLNENEIINGLYEIIIPAQEDLSDEVEAGAALTSKINGVVPESTEKNTSEEVNNDSTGPEERMEQKEHVATIEEPKEVSVEKTVTAVFEPPAIPAPDEIVNTPPENDLSESGSDEPAPSEEPFPKSVVKTGSGKIIGEYHYDSRVYKNERHYILNTRFLADELIRLLARLKKGFDQSSHSDLVQMLQDAYRRVCDNKQLHFEVATNEILNEKTLKRLWQDAKLRSLEEVDEFGHRLKAKIETLGNNYETMLREQMQRCTQKTTVG